MTRLKIAILGLLFLFVFGAGVMLTLIGQLVGIGVYLCNGSDVVRSWVTGTGQGIDGVNNAAWFGGDPRETISSHTGRWIISTQPMPLKFRFVHWLTDLFETDHCVKAISSPFLKEPL